ncbi:hypothetical protein [Nostoc sp. MG11]|uniref:hypothetical protein n=1 Tax=Nostoc sp. MG11 TaxID=2721166 RepID=UPI0018668718|nr:hypothetical protein [Nostoc sp. MG11]
MKDKIFINYHNHAIALKKRLFTFFVNSNTTTVISYLPSATNIFRLVYQEMRSR